MQTGGYIRIVRHRNILKFARRRTMYRKNILKIFREQEIQTLFIFFLRIIILFYFYAKAKKIKQTAYIYANAMNIEICSFHMKIIYNLKNSFFSDILYINLKVRKERIFYLRKNSVKVGPGFLRVLSFAHQFYSSKCPLFVRHIL